MRSTSIALFMGLGLSIAACTGALDEEPSAEPNTSAPQADPTSSGSAAPSGGEPSSPESDDVGVDPSEPVVDGGAPAAEDGGAAPPAAAIADASTDAKVMIPKPKFGKLEATNDRGIPCAWIVGGIYKATAPELSVALVTDTYDVACKATSGGYVATKSGVVISDGQTTTVQVEFPPNGSLVAVAIGGTCAFTVDGAAKGTTGTLEMSMLPGTYEVGCTPSIGSTKYRTVVVSPGEISMATFKLQ